MHRNVEFKVKVDNINKVEEKLQGLSPQFIGTDHQIDTYFNVATGRLKLREGNIENALIQYERADTSDAKLSNIVLYKHHPDVNLKKALINALGIKTVVNKTRKIYFIDNVKFHFDTVETLGTFFEVEAIDTNGSYSIATLNEQCNCYIKFFGLQQEQFCSLSYSDMLLELNK